MDMEKISKTIQGDKNCPKHNFAIKNHETYIYIFFLIFYDPVINGNYMGNKDALSDKLFIFYVKHFALK